VVGEFVMVVVVYGGCEVRVLEVGEVLLWGGGGLFFIYEDYGSEG